MWLLCSLTVSAFCFLFPLSNSASSTAASISLMYVYVCVFCVFGNRITWPNEARNKMSFYSKTFRCFHIMFRSYFGLLLIIFNEIIINCVGKKVIQGMKWIPIKSRTLIYFQLLLKLAIANWNSFVNSTISRFYQSNQSNLVMNTIQSE